MGYPPPVGGAGADILLAVVQGCKVLVKCPTRGNDRAVHFYETSRSVCKKIQCSTKIPPG